MKKPPLNGMALSELLYSSGHEQTTGSNIANPINLHNILPVATMGNCHRDAKKLAILLQNMQSGIKSYLLKSFKRLKTKIRNRLQ